MRRKSAQQITMAKKTEALMEATPFLPRTLYTVAQFLLEFLVLHRRLEQRWLLVFEV